MPQGIEDNASILRRLVPSLEYDAPNNKSNLLLIRIMIKTVGKIKISINLNELIVFPLNDFASFEASAKRELNIALGITISNEVIAQQI
jgi:hypothetical protein